MSVTRVRDSPFKESEWDRRLDDMLEDLGGSGAVQSVNSGTNMSSMTQQFSSSTTQQFSYSSSSQQQVKMQSSSSSRQQAMLTNNGRTATNNYAISKTASAASLKDSADGVLKDLENGLKQSTNYIQEFHKQYSGPEGAQEWHEVRRGGDPNVFDLEQQVQHMIPSAMQEKRSNMQQSMTSQNNSNQFTTYKVQSNQYSGAGERITSPSMEDDDRPGSRLKQNIDELDTLLYDLNNARNLSPDGGADYGTSSLGQSVGLDSDDYDETVGTTGHVKRTVNAFNEYTQQMSSSKPPSPSPRRKTQPSPLTVRKTPPSPQRSNQTVINQNSSSQSYRYQQSSTNIDDRISPTPAFPPASSPGPSFQPHQGIPGSNQPFSYTPAESPPPQSPDLGQPSYYSKYNSSKVTSKTTIDTNPPSVAFPSQTPRSPTPQMPPKRVDELMSEFHEFDTAHSGGSPTPPMFSKPKPNNSTVVVTELPDEPPQHVRLDPVPHVHEPSPPKSAPAAPKGPDVYYPPGSEFTKAVPAPSPRPPADGGSMSLETKGRGKDREKGKYHDRGGDGADKQGAAVIPICLPLCCAAPCVIM